MKRALSILQPYAWLIVRPDIPVPERARAYQLGQIKDIENRTWRTEVRGRILVHVGKKYTRRDHEYHVEVCRDVFQIALPKFEDMPLGGIVGEVDIVNCVSTHASTWKEEDSWGFVLANAAPLPFRPLRGMLGFFGVPDTLLIDPGEILGVDRE